MLVFSRKNLALMWVTLAALGPAGCAQAKLDPLSGGGLRSGSRVWPPPPDQPRVRYLGSLTGSRDFGDVKSAGQFWRELVHGPEAPSLLATPYAVAVSDDGDRVAVADANTGSVHLFDLANKTYRSLGGGDDESTRLLGPIGVTWVDDQMWVADAKRGAIARVSLDGTIAWFGGGQLERPAALVWVKANQRCYVVDAAGHEVVAFGRGGGVDFRFGRRGGEVGAFNFPSHIAVGPDDTLVVADSLNARVQRFALDGSPIGEFGRKGDAAGDLSLPKGVAVAADRTIWVADAQFENLQAFTPEGQLLMHLGGEGKNPGQFWLPAGLCIDAKQRLWVADSYNRRVQAFELLN